MSLEEFTVAFYVLIALLVAMAVGSGYAGWKGILAGIFWPVIGLVITLSIFFSWFTHDADERF